MYPCFHCPIGNPFWNSGFLSHGHFQFRLPQDSLSSFCFDGTQWIPVSGHQQITALDLTGLLKKDTFCNHLKHVAFSTKIKGNHHLQGNVQVYSLQGSLFSSVVPRWLPTPKRDLGKAHHSGFPRRAVRLPAPGSCRTASGARRSVLLGSRKRLLGT